MQKLVRKVVDTIAFTPLESPEDHQLSEINACSSEDEIMIADTTEGLIDEREPTIVMNLRIPIKKVFMLHTFLQEQ